MLDVGAPELIIILVIAIVVFGPGRLTGLGKALGDSIKGFRQAVRESDVPTAPPVTALVAAPVVTTPELPLAAVATPQMTAPGELPVVVAATQHTTDSQI